MDFKKLKKVLLTLSIAACLALPMSACVGGGNEDGAGNGTSTEQPGDDNTGDDNTGDDNTGDDNTGDDKTGDDNTGDDNVEHDCADTDNNHKCDICGETLSNCADNDNNHKCDTCGETLSQCADTDNNHKCDTCGETLSQCADNNKDHKCDVCGKELSQCADTDSNHKCDTCGETVSQCADNDKNHKCDICGETLSECADTDNNHKCDTCGETVSDCADTDNNHKCDTCGENVGEHEGTDTSHVCEYCGKVVSACVDEDANDYCDVCGNKMHVCVDSDNDHLCDTCQFELTSCINNNKDHKCDICGETVSECADDNKDHKCDICGETVSQCADDDKDHNCDVCDKELSQCADTDNNHKCDVCDKELSQCADTDNNHKCDVCDKELSQCADTDNNHKCDTCGETLSQCADTDNNHKCDTCGETLSDCADDNKDHKCDTCGETVSQCADDNKDHKCDTCGETVSECADDNKDHKCDTCGETLSECADNNKDHKCDTCGETVSQCADDNKDHKCDTCGETVSECADDNKDHKCDTCEETVSQCADDNKDHKCDICGAQWVEPIATPVLSVEGRTVTWDAQEGVTYKYRIAGGADQVATGNSITAYYNDVVSVWAVGDNVTTLDSEVASITIPAATEVYPTMEQLEAGYTFDWDKNYVGVTQGSQIPVARVQNAAAKEAMKASEDFGDYAMYLALGDQHNFMGILRDKGAITPGYTYTITVNYYCVTDNGGDYVIALGDGNANKTLVENPFKMGLNSFTFEWIPSDVQFCLTFWTNGPALDVYLGNIEVKVTKPAVVYTEVVPTLDQAKAGFTYDWENNYMAIGGGKVEEVAALTNADAKTAIQGASEGFGNVVMHVTSTSGACDLTTLTKAKNADLFQVGWTYTFEIDYYAVSVGANYMIAYNGGANNTFCGNPFKVGLNKATIQYTVGQNENMLTLYGTFDMYIGNFKLVYAEPASLGDEPTAVLTASQLNVGLDGEIVATPTGAVAQKGFGEQAVKYTQASLNVQAISEIAQLPSKVTTGLKVTIYYYVESFTGNLLLCLGAHDPFFALDASAGYHEVTVTIPANYEIQYLCWHGSGCTSAEFYIGSIEYYVLNA